MYSKNCIYDYVQLNISADNYESDNIVLNFQIPQGAYYDIKRGPVCSVALVQASTTASSAVAGPGLKNYSVRWLNPAFNTYSSNQEGLNVGNLVHFKSVANDEEYYRLNPTEASEVMTTPKPNNIRLVIVDEDNTRVKHENGYFIFRFTYYDQQIVDMNLRNEQYRLL